MRAFFYREASENRLYRELLKNFFFDSFSDIEIFIMKANEKCADSMRSHFSKADCRVLADDRVDVFSKAFNKNQFALWAKRLNAANSILKIKT